MATSLKEKMQALDAKSRKKIEARTAELIAEEMSLRDLRKAMGKTQAKMAKELGIKQEGVSRLEKRSDLLLSTLRGYVEAMGGELQLLATFHREPVALSGVAEIEPHQIPSKSKGRAGKEKHSA